MLSFQWLVDRAHHLQDVLITNVMNLSRKFNRGMCSQYDGIVRKITTQADTTEQLVNLQSYVDRLTTGELLELRVSHTYRILTLIAAVG